MKQVDAKVADAKALLLGLRTPIDALKLELKPMEKLAESSAVKTYLTYYKYFYYSIMGVSAFMLFMFVMYAFGLAGMCARRKHENFKQTCHRGTSANFLLASSGFYFLSMWVLVVICMAFYLPGITVRHLACKPALQLEESDVFTLYKAQPEIRDSLKRAYNLDLTEFSVREVLADCLETNHSAHLESLFKQVVDARVGSSFFDADQLSKSLALKLKDVDFTR